MAEQQSSIESRALEVVRRYTDHMREKGLRPWGTHRLSLQLDIAQRIGQRQTGGITPMTHNVSTWYRDHAPETVREGLDKIH